MESQESINDSDSRPNQPDKTLYQNYLESLDKEKEKEKEIKELDSSISPTLTAVESRPMTSDTDKSLYLQTSKNTKFLSEEIRVN